MNKILIILLLNICVINAAGRKRQTNNQHNKVQKTIKFKQKDSTPECNSCLEKILSNRTLFRPDHNSTHTSHKECMRRWVLRDIPDNAPSDWLENFNSATCPSCREILSRNDIRKLNITRQQIKRRAREIAIERRRAREEELEEMQEAQLRMYDSDSDSNTDDAGSSDSESDSDLRYDLGSNSDNNSDSDSNMEIEHTTRNIQKRPDPSDTACNKFFGSVAGTWLSTAIVVVLPYMFYQSHGYLDKI